MHKSHGYKLTIDPVTRIEGHLGVEVLVDGGVVKEAKASGTLFRGFEILLKGRDPRDASRLTQRVCGVCPTAHSKASALALDDAFGVKNNITKNAKIVRNLIQGSNFLQSHILHFYHLAALDYVDAAKVVGKINPFTPRYEGDYRLPEKVNSEAASHYITALDIRRKTHEMLTVFGGKMPHNVGIVVGGVTEKPTEDKITSFLWRLNEIRSFIDNVYIPDVIAVAKVYSDYFKIGKGCGNLLSYGGLELEDGFLFKSGVISSDLKLGKFDSQKIKEDVTHSWFSKDNTGKHPSKGETIPEPSKENAYSFLKSPRYEGKVYELGPLARILINYASGDKVIKKLADSLLGEFKAKPDVLFSVLGRHAARALECKVLADAMAGWVEELKPNEPILVDYEMPESSEGAGLTEAPRGSLGHWISISDKKVSRYQIVTPTAWNGSPKDDKGNSGPIEQAIIGTKVKDKENPFEIVRIIRAFDPCLACSVHLITAKGRKIGEFEVVQ